MRDLINRLLPRPVVRGGRRLLRGVTRKFGLGEPADPALSDLSGDGDWKAAGDAIVLWSQALCNVTPDAHVLDIGCGPGRMAEGLLGYLSDAGRYTGFDVSKAAIAHAEARLGSDDRAHFHHADIHNLEYNPSGKIKASTFEFPASDSSLDFAFATSVFTHMHTVDVAHYIGEIARTLKPGGCALITVFLMDSESRPAMAAGRTSYRFDKRLDAHSASIDARTPERALAFEDGFILEALQTHNLMIDGDIHRGTWRGHDNAMAFQDMIVVRKAG